MGKEDDDIDAALWAEATGETPAPVEDPQDEAAKAADADAEDGAAETPQDEAAPEPPNTDPETTPTIDLWANATPEQLAAYEAEANARKALEHRIRSDEGRVARFQRERDEARKKAAVVDNLAQQEDLEAYLASEEWTKTKAEYGDDLAPVFKLTEQLAARNKTIEQRFSQFEEDRAVDAAQSYEEWLEEQAPDRVQLFSSPSFIPWLNTQPDTVRAMAEKNWDTVVDPAEVKALCDLYRPIAGISQPEAKPHDNATDRRREVQLQGSRSVTSRAPILAGPDENDEDAAWREATAAIEKRQAAH